GALLVVDLHGWPRPRALPVGWLHQLFEHAAQVVVVVSAAAEGAPAPVLDVARLDLATARRAWASEVDAASAEHLGLRFRFNVEEVRAAVRERET
ncbi:hypothetical protein ACLESO_31790, partial [Pyxidicoccus sp. 3LG]